MTNSIASRTIALSVACVAVSLTGCGVSSAGSDAATPVVARKSVSGGVHGGQQPVSGAVIQLYAAGTGGYGSAATPLLTTTVKTQADGSFNITGDYTCPANAQVYIASTGGNPGLAAGTSNAALSMMAALGPCSALTSSTYININELTTVAAVSPLARFMSGYANVGSSPTNVAGLTNAFAAASQVVNVASGSTPGSTLPAGAILPVAELNTLANIMASCANTTGGVAGDQTACGKLFTAATPAGGSAPADTVAAFVDIAKNPANGLAALFALSSGVAPFQPALSAAPNNFLVGITYAGGGLSTPRALALDAAGNVWTANSGNSSVTKLSSGGVALSPAGGFTGGGLSGPSALAVQLDGSVWVANKTGNSVSHLTSLGNASGPLASGGLTAPASVAIDGLGNVWLANSGASSVTELNSAGTVLSPAGGFTGGGLNQPVGIAVNPY